MPLTALRELVEYADSMRMSADSQFLVGRKEFDDSQAEFDGLVAALGVDSLTDG